MHVNTLMNKRILYIMFLILGFANMGKTQVIDAPRLECVTKNNSNGDIILSWGTPASNNCGAFVQYTIYGSSVGPNGPFDSVVAVTSQAATTYALTNYLAVSNTWYFYMTTTYNCPGSTSLQSDTVSTNGPATPQIINVTVTPAGKAVINWAPDPSPQTSFYILYYYLPNGNASTAIDTIYGRLNTTTVDPLVSANDTSWTYTMAAADSCGNVSSYTTIWHNTILAHGSITECQRNLTISWNKYNHWPQGVLRYEIWVSTNLGPDSLVASTDSSTFIYHYDNFNDGDSLNVFVRAISAADTTVTSNSNTIGIHALIVQPPAYIYLTNLTVDAANHVDVTWTVDTIAQLVLYNVNRGNDTTDFGSLLSFPVPDPLLHFQSYIDSTGSPQNNPYFYNLVALDSCQNQYIAPYGETVNLQGILYEYYVAQLKWNNFVLKNATVLHYNLYRDMGTGYQLIQTFQPGVNLYYDSLQQFLNSQGTFCYRIEAVYDINLPTPSNYHDTLSSFSNVVCVIHRPIIYIPTAFSPGSNVGENTTFKPTIIYGAPQGYSMTIFNRWGGIVFESNTLALGWDGTDHGKEATMGGYGYVIQFTADDGVQIQKQGIVMLIR